MLRDSEGVTARVATIPAPLWPIVARFTGAHTTADIAATVSRESGETVPVELVERLAAQLDEALFLDTPRYRAERDKVEEEFRRAAVRPASHAGGAYHADPDKLRRYVEGDCLGRAGKREKNGVARAIIAPHIDPWRGKVGYGHAYAGLGAGLAPDVDTFVLLGTSHAPMREPFALCRKAFDTPFGPLECDAGAVDAIAQSSPFDPFADLFNHKREHSLEFQAVFVKHLVGGRKVRIVPILCGLGESQRTGVSPEKDERAEAFLRAVRAVVARSPERTVVIAGADLAHVGPRFGDPAAYDENQQKELEKVDRTSLDLAMAGRHGEFFRQVQSDLDTRRVCGLGPIYALLRTMPDGCRGELLHYEQTVDAEEGSIVSHAAMAFWA